MVMDHQYHNESYLASIFGTLLSSQGSSALRRLLAKLYRGNQSNLAAVPRRVKLMIIWWEPDVTRGWISGVEGGRQVDGPGPLTVRDIDPA
jgi:hypothetical protein